ncbi:membrane-spanning 4-domains subfamily A member 5-like [Oncorhynchus clarkii lewisi]|uniref:membrane-spanning 4-domains subfamily A member 5-like n=1 Tax=Oncorhynchus clarkii lewisi TaxID=490388 RepID=UPI0039B940BB
MSVTVTKGGGVTVFTVNSKEGSSWPLLCQILGTLCYSPACSVSQGLRRLQSSSQSALGTIQIMVGVLNIGLGTILVSTDYSSLLRWNGVPYWLGGVFIAVGIMCILAEKFPSPCLVGINVLMNLSGAALAITGIVLYAVDLANYHFWWICNDDHYNWRDDYYGGQVTKPPSDPERDRLLAKCKDAKQIAQMLMNALDIVLIVLAVLQLCVTISSAVLGLKALYKNGKEGKENIRDLEQYKPLLEEVTTNPAA